ncbi:MAG: sugar phosphate nucleotidyltransferase [Patescibacteria group bacterium]|nr:sugar phosphate nucleotidyltransferase [Patescibacteria group bacterium]
MTTSYTYRQHLYGLIMAGGGGTRLWPLSNENNPKQFLKLFGGKTLIEITAYRLNSFLPWERIYVSTATSAYAEKIRQLLPSIPQENIIIESVRRDSGPAHGLGALYIFKKDKDAVIINAASDHLVNPEKNYEKTMYAASNVAFNTKALVAVGISPLYPHTGMGHLKIGKKIGFVEGRNIYEREKHVEKPPLALAKKYTASGEYYWNANHYVWRADSFLESLKENAPDIYNCLMRISDAIGTDYEDKVLAEEFPKMPKISVDYAVSEKEKNFLMLVADYNWTDVGNWNEVWQELPKDEFGNVVLGKLASDAEFINIDTSDTLVYRNGKTIAVLGVDNIVIVDTKNALLVCSRSKAQNVKQVVEILKEKKRDDLT